jgi:hypothetical protein
LLEAVSLTNVARSFHNMVKLSEFLSITSIRDLKLGFNSEKVSRGCRFAFASCGASLLLCSYHQHVFIRCRYGCSQNTQRQVLHLCSAN